MEWFKDSKICNVALVARFGELMARGMSQRQAAKELEREQQEEWGKVLFKGPSLRRRYLKAKAGGCPKGRVATRKSCPAPPFTMANEFCEMVLRQLSRISPPGSLAGAPLTLPFLEAFTCGKKQVTLF
jgi:hypothetical protein